MMPGACAVFFLLGLNHVGCSSILEADNPFNLLNLMHTGIRNYIQHAQSAVDSGDTAALASALDALPPLLAMHARIEDSFVCGLLNDGAGNICTTSKLKEAHVDDGDLFAALLVAVRQGHFEDIGSVYGAWSSQHLAHLQKEEELWDGLFPALAASPAAQAFLVQHRILAKLPPDELGSFAALVLKALGGSADAAARFAKILQLCTNEEQWSHVWRDVVAISPDVLPVGPGRIRPAMLDGHLDDPCVFRDGDGYTTVCGSQEGSAWDPSAGLKDPKRKGDVVVIFLNDYGIDAELYWRELKLNTLAGMQKIAYPVFWHDHWSFRKAGNSSNSSHVLRSVVVQDQHTKYQVYSASGTRYDAALQRRPMWTQVWPRPPVSAPMYERSMSLSMPPLPPSSAPAAAAVDAAAMPMTMLHSRDIQLFEIPNVLTEAEMAALVALCQSSLAFSSAQYRDGRSNDCELDAFRIPIAKNIMDRIFALMGLTAKDGADRCERQHLNQVPSGAWMEPMTMTEPATGTGLTRRAHLGSNRYLTVLLGYHDAEEGGEIVFPMIPEAGSTDTAMKVPLQRGSALAWYSLYADGNINPYSTFGATQVTQGHQWLGTITCWDIAMDDETSWTTAHTGPEFHVPFVVEVSGDQDADPIGQ